MTLVPRPSKFSSLILQHKSSCISYHVNQKIAPVTGAVLAGGFECISGSHEPAAGTPPKLASEDACATIMRHKELLISGFHFRGVLPHLKREAGTYFVTFREAGSLPREVLARFKAERDAIIRHAKASKRPLTWHEQEELFRWYSHRVDAYLDSNKGVHHLDNPQFADLLAKAICFFEDERYTLCAWVLMPNHAHVVVRPMSSYTLREILHSWKSYTSHQFNKRLPIRITPFWQTESYDHLVRDADDLYRCCQYTLMNPVNAGLCARPQDWRWSSAYAP
jgi:REP element-mobilizing transposase RayT